MQSQKPSWRYPRSSPAAASRSSGSRSRTESSPSSASALRLEEEEPGVDPLLHQRLLDEAADLVVGADHRDAPLRVRPDHRHRRGRAVGAVEVERLAEVDVGDAVGVGERERALSQARSPPGRRGRPSVCRRRCRGTRPSTPSGQSVGGAELGDHLPPVPGQQEEAPEAVRRIDPDHVPDDRTAADLDERLRDRVGPLLQPGAAPSAEDRDGLGAFRHARCRPAAQPPATAGRIVTSAPSAIVVSSPSWKRMSSPET